MVSENTDALATVETLPPIITINTAANESLQESSSSPSRALPNGGLHPDALRLLGNPHSLVCSHRARVGSSDGWSKITSISDGETIVASGSISDSYRRRSVSDVTALSMASNYEERDQRPLSDITNENGSFGISPDSLDAIFEERNIKDLYSLGGLPGLAFALCSDCSSGIKLDESDILDRRSQRSGPYPHSERVETFGCNRLPEKKTKTLLQLMWAALQDRVLILLTVVATVSLILGLYQTFGQPHLPGQPRVEWVEGTTIMAAVVIVVVVSGLNDYQKERQFARLNAKKKDRLVTVIRSGKAFETSVYNVLVGDLLRLEAGDLVPADGILVSGHNIRCDESSISGESDLKEKAPGDETARRMKRGIPVGNTDPFIVSGSKVVEGIGAYMVTAVGKRSTYGKTMLSLLEENDDPTPLQQKLTIIADQIAIAGLAVAAVLFVVLTIKFLVQLPGNTDSSSAKWQTFLRIVIVSITVVVIAVPEGLPLAVTLALAISVSRMLRDNNLVRFLGACETMGNVTTVCSDKTGTLTTNKMTVVAGTAGLRIRFGNSTVPREQYRNINGTSTSIYDVPIDDFISLLSEQMKFILSQSIVINSTAIESEEGTFIGSRTEMALLTFAKHYLGVRVIDEERANAELVQIFPFDSNRKCMASVVNLGGIYRLYVKGAPEVLLDSCSQVITHATNEATNAEPLNNCLADVADIIKNYSERSLRMIGFAYRDFATSWPPPGVRTLDSDPTQALLEDIKQDMTFLGIIGIQDPLRPGVKEAISKCRNAGVSVKMVTGDNIGTAKAIAMESGILDSNGIAMEGSTFRKLSRGELHRILPQLQVLARSSPEDKRILVKGLKELDEVVAVTGDGTNDAPALTAADVGFSMGLSGTDIALEASSIILMDDNFSSIVKAIEWGRTVNDAIKKFLQFQLTVNITAVVLTFVSAITSDHEESILTPVQLLWVNLIMDTFAAMALATDPPPPSILDRKPNPKSAPLVSLTMWKMIIVQSIYQLAVTLTLNFAGRRVLGYTGTKQDSLETLVFNTYVWMQLFNQYNNRRLDNKFNIFEGLLRNSYFLFISLITISGQLLIISFGGSTLSTVRLDSTQWAISLGLGALSLPVGAFVRLVPDNSIRSLLLPFRRQKTAPFEIHSAVHDPDESSPLLRDLRSPESETTTPVERHHKSMDFRRRSSFGFRFLRRARTQVDIEAT